MNSSGSSAMTRTSSEESEISSCMSGDVHISRIGSCEESSAEDDFEFASSRSTRPSSSSSMPNPFFGATSNGSLKKAAAKADAAATYQSVASRAVNRIADLLRSLQSASSSAGDAAAALAEVLAEVRRLHQHTLAHIPARHRQRLLEHAQASSSSSSFSSASSASSASLDVYEFASLFGRCFNLSMNLKILGDAGLDSTLATRILSDLNVITATLEAKRTEDSSAALGQLMNELKINQQHQTLHRFGFVD